MKCAISVLESGTSHRSFHSWLCDDGKWVFGCYNFLPTTTGLMDGFGCTLKTVKRQIPADISDFSRGVNHNQIAHYLSDKNLICPIWNIIIFNLCLQYHCSCRGNLSSTFNPSFGAQWAAFYSAYGAIKVLLHVLLRDMEWHFVFSMGILQPVQDKHTVLKPLGHHFNNLYC